MNGKRQIAIYVLSQVQMNSRFCFNKWFIFSKNVTLNSVHSMTHLFRAQSLIKKIKHLLTHSLVQTLFRCRPRQYTNSAQLALFGAYLLIHVRVSLCKRSAIFFSGDLLCQCKHCARAPNEFSIKIHSMRFQGNMRSLLSCIRTDKSICIDCESTNADEFILFFVQQIS